MTSLLRILCLGVLLAGTVYRTASAAADSEVVLQLVDYVAVDYSVAVQNGAIVSEAEYAGMREFAARIDLLGLYPNWETLGVQR